jgi:hypothetical protein
MFRVDIGWTVNCTLLIHTFKNQHSLWSCHGSLSVMGNAVHATGNTWYASLCFLVPNISEQDCQCSIVVTWNVCAFLYIRPSMMVIFTSTCHILLNIQYIPHFLYCCIFGHRNKIVVMTCRVIHIVISNLGFESLDLVQLPHSRVSDGVSTNVQNLWIPRQLRYMRMFTLH